MKIAVIGFSGSGKSTLSRWLGEQYGAKVLHLDSVHHLPGWNERERPEEQRIVQDFLDSHDAWIIDGNYLKLSFERRLEEADQIVLMMFPRLARFLRVWRRYRRYRGKNRPDLPAGCPEKLDGKFARWVLWKGCSREKYRRFLSAAEHYPEKTVILRTQRQINEYMRKTKGSL